LGSLFLGKHCEKGLVAAVRLDKYLQVTGLIKRRALGNEACKLGLVRVNGAVAKATRAIEVGDLIEVSLARRELAVRVLQDIKGNSLKKSLRGEYFEVLRDESKGLDEGFWDEIEGEAEGESEDNEELE
jgi:ribosomal 50S subunit-recycling heat shock protein